MSIAELNGVEALTAEAETKWLECFAAGPTEPAAAQLAEGGSPAGT